MQDILLLILGLFLLVIGGHFLVQASVSAARKFKIAPFIIGATVVAFGTSAPELLVSINAAVSGHPEIALGNVVGSNIANIALVLGATACLITLPVISKRLFTDWFLVVFFSVILSLCAYDGNISSIEGGMFLLLLLYYIITAIKHPKEEQAEDEVKIYKEWRLIVFVFIIAGFALAIGAELLVKGASSIARSLNISERVISITIVAFGTSLPELATSLIAAFKKQTDISIGNIIGSNLFNILAVIGLTAVIKDIEIDYQIFERDLFIMLAIALLLMVIIYPFVPNIKNYRQQHKLRVFRELMKGRLTIIGGLLLLTTYGIYIYLLF